MVEVYITELRCIMCKPRILIVEDNTELLALYIFALALLDWKHSMAKMP